MQLAKSFEVAAPVDRVWRVLIDIEQVAPCLPGAAVTGRTEDGSYEGSFTVKLGPTSAFYTGKLEMLEIDEESHRAMMLADGTVDRGEGGATATIVSKLAESAAGGTHVEVQTDYRITGSLARFGRGGMIEDISERLLRQFAERLAELLSAPETSPEPVPKLEPEAEQARVPEPEPEPDPTPAPPDMGRVATEPLPADASRNGVQIAVVAVVAAVVGYLLGTRRGGRARTTSVSEPADGPSSS